jgi:ribose/xylose/arabinose/galactoside ABC-type transport system permease subunit
MSLKRFSGIALLIAILLECIVFASLSDSFLTTGNLVNIAVKNADIAILAVGMTLVILTGGIDLGIGSVIAAALITGVTGSATIGFLAAVSLATIFGVFNGTLVAFFKMPPFVVTLAVLTIARGLAFIVSEGRSIGNLGTEFGAIGQANFVGIPLTVMIASLALLVGWFILNHTKFGRHVYAIGGNPDAAFLAGINVKKNVLAVYILNGLLTGIAAVVLASRLGAGVPNSGEQYELDVIAAVVVGGTSLTGGKGGVFQTLLGTIFIGILNNGLNLAGIDPYLQKIALGVVILSAVFLDRFGK